MTIPVYLSDAGIPVRSVTSGAPEMQVTDGVGIPIRLADYGAPFVVLGGQPQIADFYGTGPGDIPMRLQSSTAVLSGGNVQRVPNAGGAGTAFDLIAGSPSITLTGAAMDLTPDEWLRFSNVVAASGPDLVGTTTFIVADVLLGAVDQYFMGNGNPQCNVWLNSAGTQMRFNRRNPVTNNLEVVTVNLSPSVSAGNRIYEIEITAGVPAANGQTTGGVINIRVNGTLRGTAAHPYPAFIVWNFSAGNNPANGNGLQAKVYDTLSIIRGGDHDARVPIIRERLNDIYSVGL